MTGLEIFELMGYYNITITKERKSTKEFFHVLCLKPT